MARLTPQQKRERSLMGAIAKAKAELGFRTDEEFARFLGISPSSFCQYKRKSFQNMDFQKICAIFRKCNITAKQVGDFAGIPYQEGGPL